MPTNSSENTLVPAIPSESPGSAAAAVNEKSNAPDSIHLHRPRTNTLPGIDSFTKPGAVRLVSEGAYIVDQDEGGSPSSSDSPFWEDTNMTDYELGGPPDVSTPDGNGNGRSRRYTRDIRLPNQKKKVSHIAVDIGGTLAKVVYYTPESRLGPEGESGGRLNFLCFETERVDDCIAFIRDINDKHKASRNNGATGEDEEDEKLSVMATGGGAYKFYDKIKETLNVEIVREDEMECLIVGKLTS
jgi:type II pantothenate kinase